VPCPGLEPCPSTFLLTDADAAFLVKRGINVVRVGLMWPGAMPIGPDVYNASYFAQVEKVIDLLWKHRIYSILDLHQDLLSPRLCGEGAPVWANFTQAALGGLQLPLPVGKSALPMLPSGLPNCSGSKPFPNFYSADLVGRSFEAIYSDTPPQRLGTQLANLWGEVARRFGRKAGVLAYELMNEPAVGDAIEHPEFQLHPERADRAQLAPFYAKLDAAIREHDSDTMLLYSSIEAGNFLSSPVGFEAGPGGHEYDDRQALVFHDCEYHVPPPNSSPPPESFILTCLIDCCCAQTACSAPTVPDQRLARSASSATTPMACSSPRAPTTGSGCGRHCS
jgi:endoglycosylceramidase